METQKKTTYTYKLNPQQQNTLYALLTTGNYKLGSLPYARVSAEGDDCRVVLYESGKCVIQGRNSSDFVMFTLEPHVLREARLGYEEILAPETFEQHIGVDESGKGDFFGPLVIAAAYVDPDIVKTFQRIGVRDSKTISSDKRACDMAKEIRDALSGRFAIVKIGPEAYNRLYSQMSNVNRILAWGHARAIENILEKTPDCSRAVSDQFGSKKQVEQALMSKGRTIKLEQRHKAESDMAVAAASVLARAAFLHALQALEQNYDQKFPKGASAAVIESAGRLASSRGPGELTKVAKCHFKTLDAVLAAAGASRSDLGPLAAHVSQSGREDYKGKTTWTRRTP